MLWSGLNDQGLSWDSCLSRFHWPPARPDCIAAAHNVQIFQGNCFQTDHSLPCAPLLDLFRSYFVKSAQLPLADNVRPLLAELSPLLPDLALLFPDLASKPAFLSSDPEQEKRQFFATLTYFFTEQAAQHSVLVIVEDVHWCDDLSLDFLLHLTRRCQDAPLLLLVTYRSDEVTAMLRSILEMNQEIDADLLNTIYARSEGNPFFVEELLKSLKIAGELVCVDGTWKRNAQRAPVPRSVQEMVQQRTAYLSADAKRLVTLAAVAGRRFNVTLLQEVMHCDEAHLLALLKEVMAAQLFPILAARTLDSAPESIETTSSSLRTFEGCMRDVEEALPLALQTNSQLYS